jgi:hypothetical protein
MKRIAPLLIIMTIAGSAVGQKNLLDEADKEGCKFFLPAFDSNSVNNNTLIPADAFEDLMINDIALLNGLDKGSDMLSKLNVDLLDDPSLKLTLNGKKARDKKQKFTASTTYFSNYSIELGLKEDLIDLFKNDKRQFEGNFGYSGTVFFNRLTSFKFNENSERALDKKIEKNKARVFQCNEAQHQIVPLEGDGSTYYRREADCKVVELYKDEATALSEAYKTAEWISKKFYWFNYEVKAGIEGLNFYHADKDSIGREFRGTVSADLSFNFYHWTNPKAANWRSFGTKFIAGGISFGYQPMDDVEQEDYISIANDSVVPISNKKYSTVSAYDKATYSEVIRIAPHLDYYQFLTKNQVFGLHLGVRGKFDMPLESAIETNEDVDLTAGLVFNIKGCYSNDCDEDEQASRVNFEILVVAESISANADAGNPFKDCLSPKLKVGIPFTMLNK